MAQPYDYRLNIPNPSEQISGALQATQGIQAFKAQKQAQVAQQQLQADLAKLAQQPTTAGVSQMMVKYPQLSEHFKRTFDVLDKQEKDARVGQASQVYAALQTGENDLAIQTLKDQAEGYRAAGRDKDAQAMDTMAQLIELNPDMAKTTTGLFLASAMGSEKFTDTFTALESNRRKQALEESDLTEAQAKAQKAAVDAGFAESQAVMDLQKKGWDIYKIQEDVNIAKENSRIAALKAQLAREANDLKRQQLETKLAEMERKRDEEVNNKVADVEASRMNIDNMITTLDRISNTPMDVIENATGPISTRLPTTRQSTADFEELITNLDAQTFLAQVPNLKGLGALSDAEGKKLTAALQNFSLRQSPERLLANVKEAQRLMLKARQNIADRYGVPETIPDTPEVQTTGDDIDALIQQYAPGVQ